ncbi:DUF3160 domain-containing protein [Candidatus Poribacteria bacterium]
MDSMIGTVVAFKEVVEIVKPSLENLEVKVMKTVSWMLSVATITIILLTSQTTALSYDVTDALYFEEVAANYKLTDSEIRILKDQGFVVITDPKRKFQSFGAVFMDVFKRDLPVFVTTDAILHAVHLAFDEMLQMAEEQYLYQMLYDMLAAMHQQLPEMAAPDYVKDDVDLYLSVARGLLDWKGQSFSKRNQDAQVKDILTKVRSHKVQDVALYGTTRTTDFSQFIPRGHYTASGALERYFMTMMWLGREDLGFLLSNQRQMMDAFLMLQLFEQSKQWSDYQKIVDFVSYMIGKPDNPTLGDLRTACEASSVHDVAQIAEEETHSAIVDQLVAQDAIGGRISSNVRLGGTVPPVCLMVFGQRFVLDSYVMSEVTYDRIPAPRTMPSPLDVMYVMGNDTAKPLLKEELNSYSYEQQLDQLRQDTDALDEDFWGATAYHQWLQTLRTLHQPLPETAPKSMKTRGWSLEKLNTQLASWAQLRHDTILYVKQSYAAILCEYPFGYIEPYSEFYQELVEFYEATQKAYHSLGIRDYDWYFTSSMETLQTLHEMVRKEIACEPFTDDEVSFLQRTIKQPQGNGYGTPSPSGWYAELCFLMELSTDWKPCVADVHTDPNAGSVLEVAVGDVELIIIVADNEDDKVTYVGPVFTYYEFTHPLNDRMTDEQGKSFNRKNPTPSTMGYGVSGRTRFRYCERRRQRHDDARATRSNSCRRTQWQGWNCMGKCKKWYGKQWYNSPIIWPGTELSQSLQPGNVDPLSTGKR